MSFSCRRATSVVAAALLLTAACGTYFAFNVRINTDTTDMLNPELPFRKLSNEVSLAFPQFSDNVLVVVEGDTPDLADESALKLAARLRGKPELFGRVVDQAGDPFFRRHGLLYESIEDLGDLGDRMARAQPFLGALWRDHTLRGLLAMLDLAAEEILKDPAAAPIEIGPALEAISDVIEAQRDGRFKLLSWQDIMTGEVSAPKDRRRFLLIQPALDHASLEPAGRAIAELRRLVGELGLTPGRGVQVRLTGSAALNQEEFKTVESGIGVAFLISLATVAVIVFAGLRSLRLGLAILLTLVMGLTWTGALGIALFGELNLLSVAFVVLFVGLSDDFGIHFCLRYAEHLAAGEERKEALTQGGTEIGNALFLCTVTTAAGFFAFAPTDYRGLAQLGAIAGLGILIALAANMVVVPALIELFRARTRVRLAKKLADDGEAIRGAHAAPRTMAFWRSLFRWHRPLAVGIMIAALGGSVIAARVSFDFDPLNLKDADAESVRTLRALLDDGQAGRYSATVLAKNLAEADALAGRFGDLPEVDDVRTLSSLVPEHQREKLEILSDMALFLMPALESGKRADRPTEAELRAAFVRLADRLERLAAVAESEAAAGARRLGGLVRGQVLGAPDEIAVERWRDLEHRLLVSLPGRLEILKQALVAGPVTLADVPEEFRRQFVAADGRARVEIVPRDDLRDRDALRHFVHALRAVTPEVTGSPVVVFESGQAIVRAFAQATAIAFGAVVLLLYVSLRRVGDVLLTLVPAILAAILTGTFSVLFDIPFNYANVIVLPLLFGMSVNYGIHLVLRRRETRDLIEALASSTPRAMVISATTTITSFASLALADHWGVASLGILLTAAMILTLGSSLVALPVTMAFFKGIGHAPR
ncbi:MAG: MMPL family transporter [Rhodospirillales bacterium]|nr:MMPL family transporter [Rhodospirillales bacterium]